MKVVKKTGLVPVHTENSNDVFGLPPAEALRGLAAGKLFLVEIPEGIETYEIDDKPAAVKQEEKPAEDEDVVIPGNWESLHYTKIVVLAKQILGVEDLPDRTSVVSGKSVSVRVDIGGRRVSKKKKK